MISISNNKVAGERGSRLKAKGSRLNKLRTLNMECRSLNLAESCKQGAGIEVYGIKVYGIRVYVIGYRIWDLVEN